MPSCFALETETKSVGMGQIAVAQGPARLHAVLGSCVAVALYSSRLRVGALAHVVLPCANGRPGLPGKFADTAIPEMIALLKGHGVGASGLTAKIAGGACMFAATGPMQIGDANIQAVAKALAAAGVRIAGQDVGRTTGRRVSLDCATGTVTVETVGNPPRTL